jgi:hypothetical protein
VTHLLDDVSHLFCLASGCAVVDAQGFRGWGKHTASNALMVPALSRTQASLAAGVAEAFVAAGAGGGGWGDARGATPGACKRAKGGEW